MQVAWEHDKCLSDGMKLIAMTAPALFIISKHPSRSQADVQAACQAPKSLADHCNADRGDDSSAADVVPLNIAHGKTGMISAKAVLDHLHLLA